MLTENDLVKIQERMMVELEGKPMTYLSSWDMDINQFVHFTRTQGKDWSHVKKGGSVRPELAYAGAFFDGVLYGMYLMQFVLMDENVYQPRSPESRSNGKGRPEG